MMSLHVRITGQSQYHGFRGFTMVLSKAVSHSVAGSEMFHLRWLLVFALSLLCD